MKQRSVKITACTLAAVIAFSSFGIEAQATGLSSVLPAGGVNLTLAKRTSLENLATDTKSSNPKIETTVSIEDIKVMTEEELQKAEEEETFKNLVIAQVNDYVNVRNMPSEEGEIVGKLYDESVGTFISEQDGWYEINSGSVTGYVKGEYCVTGEAAVALAREVGTRIAVVVNTQTLKVRKEPGLDAKVLSMIPEAEELLVLEEVDGWVKVNVEEGDGYISTDYVDLKTEFVEAESKEEEEKRLAKEEAERKAAQEAARAAKMKNEQKTKQESSDQGVQSAPAVTSTGDSEMGRAVADYGLQFLGNPYVYGGSSLTNGTDCSGFVMSVYANFGVSLPHSSAADRSVGSSVDSLDNAQAGDIVCYSGHVGIYIGGGQIVHASTKKTGIIVSNANYRKILAIRRIF